MLQWRRMKEIDIGELYTVEELLTEVKSIEQIAKIQFNSFYRRNKALMDALAD
jgi:transcriptional regulator NrdR family protein